MSDATSSLASGVAAVSLSESNTTPHTLKYDALKKTDHIRLLNLQPSVNAEAALKADLCTASLGGNTAYSALSYSWDGRFDNEHLAKRIIYLDDAEYEITGNLYACLRRLRHSVKVTVLWVDALCINQADNEERSSQVSLMHQIYNSADEVIVWLGEDSEFRDAETFFAFCAVLNRAQRAGREEQLRQSRGPEQRWSPDNPQPDSLIHFSPKVRSEVLNRELGSAFKSLNAVLLSSLRQRVRTLPLSPVRRLYLEAAEMDDETPINNLVPQFRTPLYNHLSRLTYIFTHRRYFSRRWILQEVSSAKNLTFVCGPIRQKGEDIRTACLMWSQPEYSNSHPGLDVQPLLRIFGSREVMHSDSGVRRLLLDMVGYHDFACQDPRDRVYALIHLRDPPPLVPDYTLAPNALFLRLAHNAVDAGEACILLDTAAAQWSACYDQRERVHADRDSALPSWTPDWSLPIAISVPQSSHALRASRVSSTQLSIQAEYIGEITLSGDVLVAGLETIGGLADTPSRKTFPFDKNSAWASDLLFRRRVPGAESSVKTEGFSIHEKLTFQGNCSHARHGDIICLSAAQIPGIQVQYAWIFRPRGKRRDQVTYQVIGACWIMDLTRYTYSVWQMAPSMRELQIV